MRVVETVGFEIEHQLLFVEAMKTVTNRFVLFASDDFSIEVLPIDVDDKVNRSKDYYDT